MCDTKKCLCTDYRDTDIPRYVAMLAVYNNSSPYQSIEHGSVVRNVCNADGQTDGRTDDLR